MYSICVKRENEFYIILLTYKYLIQEAKFIILTLVSFIEILRIDI